VPSLEECLGADNLRNLREEEDQHLKNQIQDHTKEEEEVAESYVQITGDNQKDGPEEEGSKEAAEEEAASPGAAGQLTGAEDRTGQEQ
jgi:hypothetical protein